MKTELRLSDRTLTWGSRTYVMGILNVTPDSFSGDGLLQGEDPVAIAVQQARTFVAEGADFLDVGGESTRPGAKPVTLEEELRRVIPVVQALSQEGLGPISVDTYKAAVAEAALEAGADLINDVWALRADPRMAEVIARHGAPVILMHNRSTPANAEIRTRLGGRYVGIQYENLIGEVRAELLESVGRAHAAGIPDEHIILDPGLGFGKTVEQSLSLINRLNEVRELGYPVLIGPSRKSFVGYSLDLPPSDRLEGTAAAVAVGIVRGADIVRVHDMRAMVRVARMTDQIVRR